MKPWHEKLIVYGGLAVLQCLAVWELWPMLSEAFSHP